MTHPESVVPKIVVLGAGFGGLEAAFYLRHRLGKRVELTVVSNREQFLFKPNTIYIPFGKSVDELMFPLAPVFERRHIRFVQAQVHGVNPESKVVMSTEGPIEYDYLIVATGAAMRPSEIPGLEEHANTIWSPEEMERLGGALRAMVTRVSTSDESARVLFLVPPNNKCSGPLYELVLMLDTWLRRKGVRGRIDLCYNTYEHGFIQAFGPRLHDHVSQEFAERNINATTDTVIKEVQEGKAIFSDGSTVLFDLLVSFPPYVAAQRYERLPSDDRGFLIVDPGTRQVQGNPDIYAVGDAGDFPVKQAFLALLQADTVGEHLSERILGETPSATFDPVSMCIMEQFNKATFAQVPLRLTGDPAHPVTVREDAMDQYRVGYGSLWRIGKKMLGAAIPERFSAGQPFHAGPTWAVMEAGLKVMTAAFTD